MVRDAIRDAYDHYPYRPVLVILIVIATIGLDVFCQVSKYQGRFAFWLGSVCLDLTFPQNFIICSCEVKRSQDRHGEQCYNL
jgi:hypothetical protein